MAHATIEIYRTESGSVYEVEGDRIRRTSTDGTGPAGAWMEYRAINRLPASLFKPGQQGEVLEVLLTNGKRIHTSRLMSSYGLGPTRTDPSGWGAVGWGRRG